MIGSPGDFCPTVKNVASFRGPAGNSLKKVSSAKASDQPPKFLGKNEREAFIFPFAAVPPSLQSPAELL